MTTKKQLIKAAKFVLRYKQASNAINDDRLFLQKFDQATPKEQEGVAAPIKYTAEDIERLKQIAEKLGKYKYGHKLLWRMTGLPGYYIADHRAKLLDNNARTAQALLDAYSQD